MKQLTLNLLRQDNMWANLSLFAFIIIIIINFFIFLTKIQT